MISLIHLPLAAVLKTAANAFAAKKYLQLMICIACYCWPMTALAQQPDWENPRHTSQGTLPPRAHFIPFASRETALRQTLPSPWVQSLDGKWKFNIVSNPSLRPTGFQLPSFNDAAWKEINVPANWQTAGFDSYIFTDVEYPFPPNPPKVPAAFNPVGSYRRSFQVPAHWKNKQVWIQLGAVNSFFYIWINGQYLGFSKDSKTPATFNITPFLRKGNNVLALQVFRFNDGSYLEGQDMWKLSGIERSVYLLARPPACVYDFFAQPSLVNNYRDGRLQLQLTLNQQPGSTAAGQQLEVQLLDKNKVLLSRQWLPAKDTVWNMDAVIPNISAWSAEHPNLYTLLITHKDKQGKVLETIAHQLGFRNVEIKNGLFLVNGAPIKLKGVNRHEHDMYNARVITKEEMIRDIRTMKEYNINAVRNSHYPCNEEWYELCDRYGIYVLDEANIECDGMSLHPMKTLSDNPDWEAAYLHRTRRMVQRDKNYTCIVTWSLGNESAFGNNFKTTYNYIKSVDPTRPVQYEGGGDNAWTDIYCPMYKPVNVLKRYVQQQQQKPLILCEYAHMMGNSGGNLLDDWELIYQHPQLQGGFIWDFADQTFKRKDEQGRDIWAYGGDMGTVGATSDTSFCADGLLAADRSPHPQAFEVRKVYQYIRITPVDSSMQQWRIQNHYDFTNLSAYTLRWSLRADGRHITAANMPPIQLRPGTDTVVTIPLPPIHPQPGVEYFLHWQASTNAAAPLLPKGWVAATEQYRLPAYQPIRLQRLNTAMLSTLRVQDTADELRIGNDHFTAAFSKTRGWLHQLVANGTALMASPLMPHFWRAATDNDIGNSMQIRAAVWQHAADSAVLQAITASIQDSFRITISTRHFLPTVKVQYNTSYRILANGDINVSVDFLPADTTMPELPRIGMRMSVLPAYDNVSWLGRGPFDNYADRHFAAEVAVYSAKADALFHPYPRAQESGYRTGIRWVALQAANKSGWIMTSDSLMNTGILHFNQQRLDFDRSRNKHGGSMTNEPLITWNIDYRQSGVGGDNSWGAKAHPQYRIPCRNYHYSFLLRPLPAGANAGTLAKERCE
ncbi:DUF4981 domain-containing protein [Chitinophaga pendula]|uniref:glycoside hydrolase family 2 TIM barrel-domain containing protein n=1 Tax=Chitinophaga TaxID=79328 RepID=UPI000BAEDC57|nr:MULTISPECIES: glycoside hydrolase family 2 TIM barrel-domain containing protein [Chitinophaga]ASZ13578.1 beta-galactosidase [Chitinophaga sp. MD30]UCJ08799.1 DUF4981 domain-containing protein [Chitinophaga pendula]